ncbi:hypothetical protein LTR70_005060 [Exophiala xenobiotica]|uniref:Autophagy-related protein 14 n=1 Tax=Lithohypha guttulata TaxID=1690604 RepID=A0ABR0KAL1_9EURO|nr:hypothetical protein LTR24_005536 [Lithohypha guttulata]KAK5319307.1 hypothetical protein LTR70_005060 [Exophiala xenobiotica]
MECDICQRPPDKSLDFFCTACAHNVVYVPRLEHARVLLEKNVLKTKVEEAVNTERHGRNDAPDSPHTNTDGVIWQKEWKQVQANESNRRVVRIKDEQESVRQEAAGLKAQIEALRAKITEKRCVLDTIQSKVPQRWKEDLSQTNIANSKALSLLLQTQHKSVGSRATLCREAASLMRLRQRRRQRDAPDREQYSIAGLTLPDLREISNVRGRRQDFPGPGSAMSVSSSPSASRHELGTSLKSRPLFVGSDSRDERIVNFQKSEPQAFNIFIEGIALLAWDVAWLCRTQGYTAGTNSWEEICNVGKNLHQLLIANPQAPSIARIQSDRNVLKRPGQSRKSSSPSYDIRNESTGKLGQNTDLSAASQAAKAYQSENLRLWAFLSWQAVALSLRKTLLTEITSAEWELLQDEEWDDGGEQFDEAVFVKTRALDGQQYDDARSIMTTRTRLDDEPPSSARTPGTSGWTKLKQREQS